MLPKHFKLKLREQPDFFTKAERFFSKFFTVFYQKNQQQLKVAVVVPKKVAKLATSRNKLKRQISAALLPALKENLSFPYSLVVVAKAAGKDLSVKEWRTELTKALSEILWPKNSLSW